MEKDLHIDGSVLRIKYIEIDKEKPTIVFLHDSLGCIQLWRDFPEKLAEATGCNALVYDRQGYGKSGPFITTDRENNYLEKEADVLHKLIEKTGIKEVILFGHSDGASITLHAAANYPSDFIGIITEGPHIFVEDLTRKGVSDALEAFNTTDLKERLQKYHGDNTEDLMAAFTKIWLSEKYRPWTMEPSLPRIECPVLVIQGEEDEYGTMNQVNRVLELVSGKAEKFVVPSVGHTVHKEAAEVTLKRATSFIKELVSESCSA